MDNILILANRLGSRMHAEEGEAEVGEERDEGQKRAQHFSVIPKRLRVIISSSVASSPSPSARARVFSGSGFGSAKNPFSAMTWRR